MKKSNLDLYSKILEKKFKRDQASGISGEFKIHSNLFDFQRDIVQWSIKRGRAAIFAFTGAGKNAIGPEIARIVCQQTGGRALIFEPLGVIGGAIKEAKEIVNVDIKHVYSQEDITDDYKIFITNYERMEKFNPSDFTCVILDEAAILKGFDGKTRNYFIDNWSSVPFRYVATATPAPNDYMELGNYSEFLGIMDYSEMLGTFFTHDSENTSHWTLKGHAAKRFWEWMAAWSVTLTSPSDLGYDDSKYKLPPLNVSQINVTTDDSVPKANSLSERLLVRRLTTPNRCQKAAEIVLNDPDKIWLIWTNLNCESDTIKRLIPWAVEVKGSDKASYKEKVLCDFTDGKIKCLVTKPLIAGHGLNWQVCNNMIFVGLSDSAEQIYQATRRCWRFGQDKEVFSHIVVSDKEGAVVENIKRKEAQMVEMQKQLIKFTRQINEKNIRLAQKENEYYNPTIEIKLPEFV